MKWVIVDLKDICIIHGGNPSPKENEFTNEGIPFVKMKDLGKYHLTTSLEITENKVSPELIKKNRLKIIKKGSVLLPRSGSVALNHRGILAQDSIIVSHICALEIIDEAKVYNVYLYFYLSTINMVKITKQTTGLDAITFEDLSKIQIPLPPLSMQKRIAAILDKADALCRKDQELINKYDELSQTIFIDMFGDPVKNEKGWKIGTIRDIAKEVKYGTSSPAEENGAYPYIRMNNITYSGEWNLSDLKYISIPDKDKEKYCLTKNDLVFNRTNSKDLVGKTAIFDREEDMIIAGYLIRVRFNELGNPYYVSGFLNSKFGKAVLKNLCKNIIGMANINAQELQDITLPIPPIELQKEYQDKILSIKLIKDNAMLTQSHSSFLFQSLLQQAFRGELR